MMRGAPYRTEIVDVALAEALERVQGEMAGQLTPHAIGAWTVSVRAVPGSAYLTGIGLAVKLDEVEDGTRIRAYPGLVTWRGRADEIMALFGR